MNMSVTGREVSKVNQQSVAFGLTDGLGGVVTPGEMQTRGAVQLTKEMRSAVDDFQAGRVGYGRLQELKQRGEALLKSGGVADVKVMASLREGLARIDAQGRTLGDDKGGDVIAMLKQNRSLAQQGKLTYAELSAAVALAEQVQNKHEGHWASGAADNVDLLQQDIVKRYLPEVQASERKQINALELARVRYEAQPTAQNFQALQQQRDALNQRFNSNSFAPENGEVLQGLLRQANVTLAQPQLRQQSRAQALEQDLGRAMQAYQQQRTPAQRKALNDLVAELRSERSKAGQSGDTPLLRQASQLLDAPLKGQERFRDIDPDGSGPLKATYVGRDKDDTTAQTRVRIKETYDGKRWVTSYQAVGLTVTDANGKFQAQRGRVYDLLTDERGAKIVTDEQAVNRARQLLKAGAISTSDAPSTRPPTSGNPVLSPNNDGRFESTGVAIPAGVKGLGNPYVAGLRGLLDRQVAPDAQRYLQSSSELIRLRGTDLISLRGTDLQNYIGVAMNLAPNVVPVQGGGAQVLYQAEALKAITPVAQAIRKVGGDGAEVRAVPVYLRVADDKMAKTTIFRVRGADGQERIVDQEGATYATIAQWKKGNGLGAVDVYLPKNGQLQADGNGKVVFDAFNNRRLGNTALPVVQGGVALLGAGAGVAVILGTGGTAAPIILAGASAFSAANGTLNLVDRNNKGQTLSLSDEKARAAWMDVAGGLFGVGAIGTGSRVVRATSDVIDLITLGEGGRQYVRDFNKMSVGERVVAGSQLLFWGAMMGADLSHSGKGRFDLDALNTRIDLASKDYRAVGGDGTPTSPEIQVPNSKPRNRATPTGRGNDVTIDVTPRPTPQPTPQQVAAERRQQVAAAQFSDPTYQASLRQRLKEVAGDDPGRIERIANDAQQLEPMARKIALDQLKHRMFAGSDVPESLQKQFLSKAETWARLKVSSDGGTVARHLENLALNGSQTRADLLRPLVAQQMGGGNERLQRAIEPALAQKNLDDLRTLLKSVNGGPSPEYVAMVHEALVRRWSEDFKPTLNLTSAEERRLYEVVRDTRLNGKTLAQQRQELVKLANSPDTRDSLVKQATQSRANDRPEPATNNDAPANNITSTRDLGITSQSKPPSLTASVAPPGGIQPEQQALVDWAHQIVIALAKNPTGDVATLLRSNHGFAYGDTRVVAKLLDTEGGPVIRILGASQQTLLEVPLNTKPTPSVEEPATMATPPVKITTADELLTTAALLQQMPPAERRRVGDIFLTLLNREQGSMPSIVHDVHSHEGRVVSLGDRGPGHGTYDPTYTGAISNSLSGDERKELLLLRALEQYRQFPGKVIEFGVAPLFPVEGHFAGSGYIAAARYYAAKGEDNKNILGVIEFRDGKAISNKIINDRSGNPAVLPFEMPIADFEVLIGREVPKDAKYYEYICGQPGCNLHYGGTEVDLQMLKDNAQLIEYEQRTRNTNIFGESHIVGLTAGNPRDANGHRQVFRSIAAINSAENFGGLEPGTIQAIWGETNLSKELVHAMGGQRPLLRNTQEELNNLDKWAKNMARTGQPVIIHCDSGLPAQFLNTLSNSLNAFLLPSDNKNIQPFIEFAKRNPETTIIWAHAGLGYTVQMPPGYLNELQRVLDEAPNVNIDISWDAIYPYISQDVEGWARFIVHNEKRLMWGSDTIATSQNRHPHSRQAVAEGLANTGLLRELDRLDPTGGAKERLMHGNFEETILPGVDRLIRFRTDPLNHQWLTEGGHERNEPPPMIWRRGPQGQLEFVPNPEVEQH